ncbi:hypothetical protein MAR_021022 [Mya arenaria]|uniref:Uncharacterized protein n=1 Tax=Mya arenaria TaxID=6604 RepID=A0ABY7E6N8_MYAAR|nr:hypothetical protein MAR_021022 [Mya arenaria]
MDMFKRISYTALNAVLSVTPQFIKHAATRVTLQFIKNKATQFIEWVSDYVEPQTFSQTLDEIKEHERRSALRRFTTQYEIEGRRGYIPQTFLDAVRPDVIRLISANQGTDVSDLYTTMTDIIMEAISNFQRQGSNWVFKEIISLENHTVKYQPLRGNSYIPLPQKLASKMAITNMKNEDDMCFMWSVLRALNPVDKHSERIDKSLKGHKDLLNMNGIEYPVTLKAIYRFERQNVTISVNVYDYENGDVYPLRVSKHKHQTVKSRQGLGINLLLIDDGVKQHYCLIKSMSRLLSTQSSKNEHTRHYCLRYLNSFISEDFLSKHKEY